MRRTEMGSREAESPSDIIGWMAGRWADLERRDSGSKPQADQAIEPGAGPDTGAPQAMDLGLRFQSARPGDSISGLLGSSDPRAIGKFLALNGMDGAESTLRAGRSYIVPNHWDDATSGEAKAGHALLGADNARLQALADQRARQSRQAELFRQGRNIWTGEPTMVRPGLPAGPSKEAGSRRSRFDDDPTAKAVVGGLGWGLGLVPGVVRGGLNTIKGAGEGAYFVYRLTDPLDPLRSLPGQSAREQLVTRAGDIGDYVMRGIEDPSMVRADIASGLHDFNLKQNVFATPAADTLLGEYHRAFNIGMNNGELASDVGSLAVGGEFMRGAAGIGKLAKGVTAQELAFLADNPGLALRWNEPYRGKSHHILPVRAKLPSWLTESDFNKIRYKGMTTRDVYRNHVGVDPHYSGGKVGAKYGGTRWSAERDLGWTSYGPLDRLNYGTSPYTKAVVGPVLFGGTIVDGFDGGVRQ